ncbi:MAG TPA: LysR substrate-binding domain-containing protein [Anaeromyxobacteraceae bacterium]|nr:LysR substrate-binding domain-containing protein [Anaeromyxobacteraceae bacterium]
MELRHLRYFLAVADELHFGRAAARLGVAQPPLSHQIRQLERELGFELFVRTSRRVQLTDAGRAFRDEARAILARLGDATAAARRVAEGEAGALAVGFVASATYALLPRLYRRFRERHPAVALTLTELSTAEQVVALRAGQIQVGLARLPVGSDAGLAIEPLVEEPLVVALPTGHPLASAPAVALAALAREPFVLFPRQPRPGWIDVVQNACAAAGFRPAVAQEALELSTAVTLVAAGIGVTLVPASAQALRLAGVVYRPLEAPAPTTHLLALHRPDEPRPVVARFLEVAREVVEAGHGRRERTSVR